MPLRISAARKVDTAAERIHALNPHVRFAAHATRLDADNAMELIGGYDLVLDGSDNFETRYLVSDACFLAGQAVDHGSAGHVRRIADDDPRA